MVLGTLHLAPLPPREGFRLLDAFAAAGGRAVDTAAFYGSGYVESVLGAWLRRTGAGLRVTTKIGHFGRTADHRSGPRIEAALAESVARLGTVPDEVLLHEGDWACWWDPAAAPGTVGAPPAGTALPAWETLRSLAGREGFTAGLSGNNAGALHTTARRTGASRVLVAKQYDLVWRTAGPLLDDPARSVLLGAPFHQGAVLDLGALAAGARRDGDAGLARAADEAARLLDRHGLSPLDAAVPFVLAERRAAGVCVGLSGAHEVPDLVRAAGRVLPADLVAALRRTGVRRAPRPGPGLRPEYLRPGRDVRPRPLSEDELSEDELSEDEPWQRTPDDEPLATDA
ncbi:aldo/keto reductase [Kitasatospora purpeofusca]|uniref:Aldo/keto reductase n=1 Tax=Kitasatospora purpeofusca TaxID=67352 RepID=A0ABZ1UF09_9ACTN|nr:aldo/keto reductase [Kitasatospora purpeofusca]